MTTLEVLNAATSYLVKHGVESARLNAEHLLAHVLGMRRRIDLYLQFERPLSEGQRAPLRELVKRRADGIPLQHILGEVEFCGRVFSCDARALIPRPETELLVELVLKESGAAASILDVATGSGVIGLSLALSLPDVAVTLCDISPEALSLAGDNALRHGIADKVTRKESDLLDTVEGIFDIIVSNPPYIPTADIVTLSREVLNDPVLALDGGADGLMIVEKLVEASSLKMSPGGLLAMEIGHDQAARVVEILKVHNFRDIVVHRDYQDVERFVFSRHG
ncbi:MAG: peptide chain release factor N(5)-glutamine methyltransferase [Verrucomicrobia bacterium]|nr:peptide chain release factor N(5)-glutamine methyltransferase [Verrucomicrobiota bacterium]